MRIWSLLSALFHVISIASLFPEAAGELSDQTRLWLLGAQFPVLAATVYAHAALTQSESRLAGVARIAVGLGITFVSLTLLVRFRISLGAADPFAVPDGSSPVGHLAWFAGFAAIATLGHTLLLAAPGLRVSDAALSSMAREPSTGAFGAFAGVGLAFGVGAAWFVQSEHASRAAAELHRLLETSPVTVLLAMAALPVLLLLLQAAIDRGPAEEAGAED